MIDHALLYALKTLAFIHLANKWRTTCRKKKESYETCISSLDTCKEGWKIFSEGIDQPSIRYLAFGTYLKRSGNTYVSYS